MPKKLPIWDHRMLLLMKHCIDTSICNSKKDFLETIGMLPQNLSDVINGNRSFTIRQMVKAATEFKVSMNWITGLDTEMKMTKGKSSIQQLREAVTAVEMELKAKSNR